MFTSNAFNSLPRSTPVEQAISAVAIEELTHALTCSSANMRGYMLARHGKVIAEQYWKPYSADDRVWVYSVSKSFTSTAVGLAIDEGLLSLDDTVISFFPEKCPEAPSDNLRAMRVRDLLSMTTGHQDDTAISLLSSPDGDWVGAFLSLPVEHEPGTHFLYNSGGSFMLAAILQKVTGEKLLDYLAPRLFVPLGFDSVDWDENPMGIAPGGWGISVRLEDIAKLGQLYLNRGVFNGKRILSEQWVEQATGKRSDNSGRPGEPIDWSQGYGFQFWLCQHGAFRMDGAAGQYCIIMPEQDAVLAIMSEIVNMQELMDIVWSVLLPGFDNTSSPVEQATHGKVFSLDANFFGLSSAGFSFDEKLLTLTLQGDGQTHTLKAGRGEWHKSETTAPIGLNSFLPMFSRAAEPKKIAGHFSWSESNELVIKWVYLDTPHRDELICRFTDGGVSMVSPPNLAAQALGMEDTQLNGNF